MSKILNKISCLDDLFLSASRGDKSVVSIAAAHDHNVLEAACSAYAKEIASFILVGDEGEIKSIASEHSLDISGMEIINEPDLTLASQRAVGLVSDGKAQAVMKGLADTSIIMKAVLSKEFDLRTGNKLSHVAVFEMPTYHKLLFITDAALNIAPDINEKREIIINAVSSVTNLGIQNPKVAILAAKEKADPKMPATTDAAELVRLHSGGEIPGCIIEGPYALDNAVSKESAKIKGLEGQVAGDADILVCPNIESGNILYKALAFLGGGKNGGVVVGAKRPIIMTSRADSAESKLISIALGVLF